MIILSRKVILLQCYICDTEMEEKTLSEYKTCWGDKKTTIRNVKADVCPKCGEIVFDMGEALRIQNLAIKQVTTNI